MMILLSLFIILYTIDKAVDHAHALTDTMRDTIDTSHILTLPLTKPGGGRITIDLPHTAALDVCNNVPPDIDDSKSSFPLHVTIATKPKILPVKDKVAVGFCNEVRRDERAQIPFVPSLKTTVNSVPTSTSPQDLVDKMPQVSVTKSTPITTYTATSCSPIISYNSVFTLKTATTQPADFVNVPYTSKLHRWMERVISTFHTTLPTSPSADLTPTLTSSCAANSLHSFRLLKHVALAQRQSLVRRGRCRLDAGVLVCDTTAVSDGLAPTISKAYESVAANSTVHESSITTTDALEASKTTSRVVESDAFHEPSATTTDAVTDSAVHEPSTTTTDALEASKTTSGVVESSTAPSITRKPPPNTTAGDSHEAAGEADEAEQLRKWQFGRSYDRRIRLVMGLGWAVCGAMVLVAAWNFAKHAWGGMPQLSKSFC